MVLCPAGKAIAVMSGERSEGELRSLLKPVNPGYPVRSIYGHGFVLLCTEPLPAHLPLHLEVLPAAPLAEVNP